LPPPKAGRRQHIRVHPCLSVVNLILFIFTGFAPLREISAQNG
jgi:hypothetical protein